MRLIDRVTKDSPSEVERYLRELACQRPDQLTAEMTARNVKGMTAFFSAIERGDLAMVRVLLSFDPAIDVKLDRKTSEQYAKQLAESKHSSKERQQIYALIKSRGCWQSSAARALRVSFQRILQVIEYAMENVCNADNKIGVLFFGTTGEGKSTLVNYLCGVDYKHMVGARKRVTPLHREFVQSSSATTSETLLPQIVQLKESPLSLIDLPGFEDTRGRAEEICAVVSLNMMMKKLAQIQALPLVCSWSSLEDPRMLNFRNAAAQVGAIISVNPKTADNVILVITKIESYLKEEDVRACLQELAKAEGWSPSEFKEAKHENLTPEQWRSQCIRRTTTAILSRKNSIILADVTTPVTREKFQKLLSGLAGKAQKPDQFNFKHHNYFLTQFQTVIEDLIQYFIDLDMNRAKLSDAIKRINHSIEEKASQIEQCTKDLKEAAAVEAFDPTPYLRSIRATEEKINQLKTKQSELRDAKKSKEKECESGREHLVYHETQYTKVQRTIEEFREKFKYDSDGLRKVNEEAAKICDLFDMHPEEADRIRANLNQSMRELSDCQQSLWAVADEIRQQESVLASQKRKLENAKSVHESKGDIDQKKIASLNERIKTLNKESSDLVKEQELIEKEIAFSEMQQEVNQDLLVKVRDIIKTLGFKSDKINRFMARSRGDEALSYSKGSISSKVSFFDGDGDGVGVGDGDSDSVETNPTVSDQGTSTFFSL